MKWWIKRYMGQEKPLLMVVLTLRADAYDLSMVRVQLDVSASSSQSFLYSPSFKNRKSTYSFKILLQYSSVPKKVRSCRKSEVWTVDVSIFEFSLNWNLICRRERWWMMYILLLSISLTLERSRTNACVSYLFNRVFGIFRLFLPNKMISWVESRRTLCSFQSWLPWIPNAI